MHGIDVNAGVAYYGKWQMDAEFIADNSTTTATAWLSGGRFTMPEPMQDMIAYTGYRRRGWQPWACARIVGVR